MHLWTFYTPRSFENDFFVVDTAFFWSFFLKICLNTDIFLGICICNEKNMPKNFGRTVITFAVKHLQSKGLSFAWDPNRSQKEIDFLFCWVLFVIVVSHLFWKTSLKETRIVILWSKGLWKLDERLYLLP